MPKKFQGEIMHCIVCDIEEMSHPDVESDWRCLDVGEEIFYACPAEFPRDRSPKEEFKTAYQLVLACCFNEIIKKMGGEIDGSIESYRAARIAQRNT
jgi:hypothetical protein